MFWYGDVITCKSSSFRLLRPFHKINTQFIYILFSPLALLNFAPNAFINPNAPLAASYKATLTSFSMVHWTTWLIYLPSYIIHSLLIIDRAPLGPIDA